MNRRPLGRIAFATAAAALVLLIVASAASASELKPKCGGKGPRNADSAGTVLCAAAPGKARIISGARPRRLRQAGRGEDPQHLHLLDPGRRRRIHLNPTSTKTIVANANGAFSLPVRTSTRLGVKFETIAAEKLGVSGTLAEAQASRQLVVRLKKLGGGKIKISVKGASKGAIKVCVRDSFGCELNGVKPRRVNKGGVASFNLGNLRGEFSHHVDAGVYSGLCWEGARPTFKL